MMNNIPTVHKEDNTINGDCSRCGKCCANILLLRQIEIDKIKKFLKGHLNFKPSNTIFDNKNVCPFLFKDNMNENSCFIYPVRPEICRKFSCNSESQELLNYNGLRAINMMKTFFPSIPCPEVDLTEINKRIFTLQNKIKGKKNK